RLERRGRPDPEADVQSAVAEHVQGCNLLCSEQRISARNYQTGNAKANRPNESGKIGKRRHRFVKVGTASRTGILGARRYVRTVNFFRPREVIVGIVPQVRENKRVKVRENKRVKVCDVSKMSPTGG